MRASIKGLRSLLVDIYPASLQTAGLDAALTDLVGGLAARGVAIDLELRARRRRTASTAQDQAGLPGRAGDAAQRASRTRTPRRSSCGSTADDVDVVLEVDDDGVGFDVPADARRRRAEGHFGLRLLGDLASSRRARELEVRSAPGAGLAVAADGARRGRMS